MTTGSATLGGELLDLGGADAATYAVEHRKVPTAEWTRVDGGTRAWLAQHARRVE